MDFLKKFQMNMELKMDDTKNSMEKKIESTNRKIDGRLDAIDTDIKNMNGKMKENEEVNRRMDARLHHLEVEMNKSVKLKRRREELREKEQNLESQPLGRTEGLDRKQKNQDGKSEQVIQKEARGQPVRAERMRTEENDVPEEVSQLSSTYRLDWAQEMEKQLKEAAEGGGEMDRGYRNERGSGWSEDGQHGMESRENWDESTPDCWEDRWQGVTRKSQKEVKVTKVRKPITITKWFGLETSTDESEIEEKENWTSVERKQKSEEKKRRRWKRKEELKSECASRAACMAGIGPISLKSIEFFRNKKVNFEEAKVLAVKEFLKYNLDYEEEELNELNIMETRLSTKGEDVIYVAMSSEEEIKELYIRKAEAQNEDILVRSYVPPNYYDRFMHLSRVCTEKRSLDKTLKTQLRFGWKDIEIFTKYKGEEAGYRKVKLSDFTDILEVPEFNEKVKWKRYIDKPPRRKANYQSGWGQRPSTVGQLSNGDTAGATRAEKTTIGKVVSDKPLIRANSNTLSNKNKKAKLNSSSDEDMSGVENDEESGEESGDSREAFETPTGKKQE